jgi:hypothetical protein
MTTLTSDRQTKNGEPLPTYNTFSPKTERMYCGKWGPLPYHALANSKIREFLSISRCETGENYPKFAQSSRQIGTVPFCRQVLKLALEFLRKTRVPG